MANVFVPSNQQWIIDTVDNTVAGFMGSDPVKVKNVRWVDPSTAGHTAVITDADGAVLLSMIATADNTTEEAFVEEWWSRGFRVPTLASGKLYVNLE